MPSQHLGRENEGDDFTVTGDELDLCLDRAERAEAELGRLHQALAELAGDYGCTTIEPLDPAFPPTGDPCRDRRPDQPETWCYACHATVALTGTGPS